MISRCFIIYFLGIENLFDHVLSDESTHKIGIEFEVELLENLGLAVNPSLVQKIGPQFPEDNRIRNELCIAAKNYVSFEIDNSAENLSAGCSLWNTRDFLDPQNDTSKRENKHSVDPSRPIFLNYIFCNTIPKNIYLRATDSPNTFVITLEGIFKIGDGVYHGLTSDIKEYSFKMKIVEAEPLENINASAGESGKDTLPMGNKDLPGVYKETNFLDWIYICLKARDYIHGRQNFHTVKPVAQCSPAGLRSLKMYDYKTGNFEKPVAFRCPIVPPLYVYFSDSETVTAVLVLKT